MLPQTSTGIPGVSDVPWGTHYCHFYDSRDDLTETLIRYVKAGLDANEACVWVTSEPLRAVDARAALAAIAPDLAAREASGQIEIVDHEDWYLRTGKTCAAATVQRSLDREQRALARGYSGLRITGNTCWLERRDWDAVVDYERLVNHSFRHRRILALCSYCFGRCSSADALDVVANHRYALIRRKEAWHVVESPAVALAEQDLLRVQEIADALRVADRRKDEFIAMLGHELRNPLAPIATAVELMRLRDASRHVRELDVIERQLRQLTTLVDDLLDLSRFSRGMVQLRIQPVRIGDVLGRALEQVAPLVAQRRHRIACTDRAADAMVDGDLDRLVQVFGNVLGNAAKYTPSGGAIGIEVGADATHVSVVIRDNGPGIADDLLPHVFEAFVQGNRSLDRREGLGLGLPIVKGLVEMHRGEIQLASSRAGTTMTIRIPVATAAPLARADHAPADRPEQSLLHA